VKKFADFDLGQKKEEEKLQHAPACKISSSCRL
jgi:hypothetical protein